jgi:hypothetical protein
VRGDVVDRLVSSFCPSSMFYSTQLKGPLVRRLGGFDGVLNALASVVLP